MTSNPLFSSALDPRDHHTHRKHSHGSRAVKFLLYACLAVLLVTCVSLSIVVKGSQRASQELRQQLLAEQLRYNRLKQTSAEEKVVIVDAEEKVRQAERLAASCRLELQVKTTDAEEAEQNVRNLESVVTQAKEEAQACEDRVSRGLGVIDKLTNS